jgi:hypothetical protein
MATIPQCQFISELISVASTPEHAFRITSGRAAWHVVESIPARLLGNCVRNSRSLRHDSPNKKYARL